MSLRVVDDEAVTGCERDAAEAVVDVRPPGRDDFIDTVRSGYMRPRSKFGRWRGLADCFLRPLRLNQVRRQTTLHVDLS